MSVYHWYGYNYASVEHDLEGCLMECVCLKEAEQEQNKTTHS